MRWHEAGGGLVVAPRGLWRGTGVSSGAPYPCSSAASVSSAVIPHAALRATRGVVLPVRGGVEGRLRVRMTDVSLLNVGLGSVTASSAGYSAAWRRGRSVVTDPVAVRLLVVRGWVCRVRGRGRSTVRVLLLQLGGVRLLVVVLLQLLILALMLLLLLRLGYGSHIRRRLLLRLELLVLVLNGRIGGILLRGVALLRRVSWRGQRRGAGRGYRRDGVNVGRVAIVTANNVSAHSAFGIWGGALSWRQRPIQGRANIEVPRSLSVTFDRHVMKVAVAYADEVAARVHFLGRVF